MISVGDLVQVVFPTPCCKADGSIGKIFEVSGFLSIARCRRCGRDYHGSVALLDESKGEPIVRLKKIPPLEEPEFTNEEMEA